MAVLVPVVSLADEAAVGASSAIALYQFIASGACWISQGSNPTASAGAGSTFVPAGEPAEEELGGDCRRQRGRNSDAR
jgi:hypothetical protein